MGKITVLSLLAGASLYLNAQQSNLTLTPAQAVTPVPQTPQQVPGVHNRQLYPNVQQQPPATGEVGGFRQRYSTTNAGWTGEAAQPAWPGTNIGVGSYNPNAVTNLSRGNTNILPGDTNVPVNTNVSSGTNSQSMTNSASHHPHDQATTPADERLVLIIRQQLEPLAVQGQPWAPVHFVCNRGVVMVLGVVADPGQKQQIYTLVRRIPGVVQVVDGLQIAANPPPGTVLSEAAPAESATSAQSARSASNMTQDHAVTLTDRNLVQVLHQSIQPVIGNAEPLTPVHFDCRNGVVVVLGFVPSEAQRQQVVGVVQQTPGVIRVIDQLQINAQVNAAGSAPSAASASTPAQAPLPTPVAPGMAPTGRTDNQPATYEQGQGSVRQGVPQR